MGIRQEIAPFLETFRANEGSESQPEWLADCRKAAMQRFAEQGYPKRNQEAWRFTDLRMLTAAPILPAPAQNTGFDAALLAPLYMGGPTHRLVLVNGVYVPAFSEIGALPSGVWLGSTAEALRARPDLVEAAFDNSETIGKQPFASLNAAFFADGFILSLEPGAVLDTPVEIIHYGRTETPGAFHLRNVVIAGAFSRATLIETVSGSGSTWTNMVTRVDLHAGARIRHVKIQNEGPDAMHMSLVRAALARQARYESFTLTLGARLSRQDIEIVMAGEGASLALNGAYLLRDEQEATLAPIVDHQAPGGQTCELWKGVIQDRAHGVFLGSVTVRPGADQTDAQQLNRNLLLSPGASVDTKPELAIHADEVKCSHGATVGDLDEASLFYLRARGIEEATARHMLIEAFAADAIERADLGEALGAHLRSYLQGWLEPAGSGA